MAYYVIIHNVVVNGVIMTTTTLADVQFRLEVADSFEIDFIANRYCDPPLCRKRGEPDTDFRIRIKQN